MMCTFKCLFAWKSNLGCLLRNKHPLLHIGDKRFSTFIVLNIHRRPRKIFSQGYVLWILRGWRKKFARECVSCIRSETILLIPKLHFRHLPALRSFPSAPAAVRYKLSQVIFVTRPLYYERLNGLLGRGSSKEKVQISFTLTYLRPALAASLNIDCSTRWNVCHASATFARPPPTCLHGLLGKIFVNNVTNRSVVTKKSVGVNSIFCGAKFWPQKCFQSFQILMIDAKNCSQLATNKIKIMQEKSRVLEKSERCNDIKLVFSIY